MEKMWLRLPRLLFIQKQIISRPSCNAFPFTGVYSLPGHLPQGLTYAILRTFLSASTSLSLTRSLSSFASTASSNELGWQVGGRRAAGGRR